LAGGDGGVVDAYDDDDDFLSERVGDEQSIGAKIVVLDCLRSDDIMYVATHTPTCFVSSPIPNSWYNATLR